LYPLPQTTLETWRKARPDEARNYSKIDLAEILEEIGPHQAEDGRIWFGKTFYNSEGATGVGGFGWFDLSKASYHLIPLPEIYAWSISGILVEPESVWLALYRRGEYGNYPGGLLRWDRGSEKVARWDTPWVVTGIARGGDAIYMGATGGIVKLQGDKITSYFVDRSAAGQYQIAARN
jgi:hypothetical protein